MKKILPALFIFIFALSNAQTHDSRFVDGRFYLRLKTADNSFGLTNINMLPLVALYHMDTCYRPFAGLGNDSLDRTYCLRFSDTAKTQACMDSLKHLSIIDMVEQIPIYHVNYVPNDVNPNQYAISKINAEAAWSITKGSTSVIVAIVDNGILTTHQDLVANLVAGYDVADNDNNPSPPIGFSGAGWNHGTHTAGIASAATDNNTGIASIGFNTKIMPVKCTNDTSKSGDELYFADEGITYAMRNGAKVISMSFGGYQNSATEQLLVSSALAQGIVMVAAAGNDDSDVAIYPGAYTGVICVGASDANDKKANFSNYGSRINIMAPGVGIYSTFATATNAYGTFSGTSMSTPMVAGLAALVLAKNPGYSPAQVLSAIQNGADNINAENANYVGKIGSGRINAFHALGGVGTGIEANQIAGVTIYPNPFNDKLNIETGSETISGWQVYDLEGKLLIQTKEDTSPHYEIDTQKFTPGVYILKIFSEHGTLTNKLIKM